MTASNPTVSTPNGTVQVDGAFNGGGSFQPAHLPATTAFASANNATASATVNAATVIVPASTTRRSVTICNRSTGNETIDIGPAGVTVGGGIPIVAGGDRTIVGPGAAGPIYVASPVAGTPISWVDA